MSIEGQGHFFTTYFQILYILCFTRPRYQVSVYRTIGPLVYFERQAFVVLVSLKPHMFSHEVRKTSLCIIGRLSVKMASKMAVIDALFKENVLLTSSYTVLGTE